MSTSSSNGEAEAFNEKAPHVTIPVDKTLGAKAKQTSAKGTRAQSLVMEVRRHLRQSDVHGRIRNFHVPPTYEEVFAGAQIPNDRGWFVETTEWFKTVVHRYTSGHFDLATIDNDIIQLSAQLVFFSGWVNHLDSLATEAEATRKQAELRAVLEIRSKADEMQLPIRTLGRDVITALASEETRDRSDYENTVGTVAATVKGFYFALKDFVQLLDRVSQRGQGERYMSQRHAQG